MRVTSTSETYDCVTNSSFGHAKTMSGGIKWFGWGEENRIKLILDRDEQTLEFQLLKKEDQSFWKVKLPHSNRNLPYFPFVAIYYKDDSVKFC